MLAPSLREAAASAMRANGFLADFPADVMQEVASIKDASVCQMPGGTQDLRTLMWSSVDNRESRDLDQIEVAERLGDGSIRVRIGVADVESLVPLGSHADIHAAANTTSVYTGVAVFPMLPNDCPRT
jgi:exoribonuclease-2